MPANFPHDRIIDANLNRAREAARVIEEYSRFLLNDALSMRRLKLIRHSLADVERGIGSQRLLRARDTPDDAGVNVTTPSELSRLGPRDVASAGFKRLQEALRVLEEYVKLDNADMAAAVKQARYEAYTLEREVLLPRARVALERACVMLIVTESVCKRGAAMVLRAAYAAGVRCFQLREKDGSDAQRLARMKSHMLVVRECGNDTCIIVNDRCDMALALGADGVHLGQEDCPLSQARSVTGADMLLGLSAHVADEMGAGDEADYFGAGAAFPTQTKAVTHRGGVPWCAQATRMSAKPVFCIGGIDDKGAVTLREAGVRRIAVCSAICAAENPERAAAALLEIFPPLESQHHQNGDE